MRPRVRKARFTWEGVYPHLRDVPAENANYDHADRVREAQEEAEQLITRLNTGQLPGLWHNTFCTVAVMASNSNRKLRVLDFGGSLGSAFIQLMATAPMLDVEYHVVDLPAV